MGNSDENVSSLKTSINTLNPFQSLSAPFHFTKDHYQYLSSLPSKKKYLSSPTVGADELNGDGGIGDALSPSVVVELNGDASSPRIADELNGDDGIGDASSPIVADELNGDGRIGDASSPSVAIELNGDASSPNVADELNGDASSPIVTDELNDDASSPQSPMSSTTTLYLHHHR